MKNKTVTLQLQVEINEDKLNDIYGLKYPYVKKYGKTNQKVFLAKLLTIGFDNMKLHLETETEKQKELRTFVKDSV